MPRMPAKSASPAKPARKKSRKADAPPARRRSRVFTISLPPELATRAEAIAKDESRTISEVFREALRAYEQVRLPSWLEKARAYGATRNPRGYTEEDLPRLVREVRAEIRAEQEQQRKSRRAG